MPHTVSFRTRKRTTIAMFGIAVALLLLLVGARPAAAACLAAAAEAPAATASIESTSATANGIVTPQVVQWSWYDGSQITSAAKCASRMAYLKSVRPDIKYWKCQKEISNTCPAYNYWLVMVGTNGF